MRARWLESLPRVNINLITCNCCGRFVDLQRMNSTLYHIDFSSFVILFLISRRISMIANALVRKRELLAKYARITFAQTGFCKVIFYGDAYFSQGRCVRSSLFKNESWVISRIIVPLRTVNSSKNIYQSIEINRINSRLILRKIYENHERRVCFEMLFETGREGSVTVVIIQTTG